MRIKRIEVIGFKSFCDRAVLNFGEPIVGVVGPNGCGKSNIVDAIRWCMGEQSAKNLRGQAMGDVIFAGSDTRGPAGMAEVSLTFEDVGFSHETLQLALEDEESLAESTSAPGVDQGDEEDLDEAAAERRDVAADVAADKAAMAKLAEQARAARAEQDEAQGAGDGTADPESESTKNSDSEISADGDVTASGESAEEAMPEEEVDPYQATKDAAKILADKPPVIDYAKYSEVTITRRLFRDGTSSYFLNKVPCRLRDITDFFLGSGVGTKAYSIIEQGRIGMIVSARAGDRRHIIEEAAGITKFKTKKRAAERKLEQTRQNLLRVSDIVSELAKRLGSLRRQAQKAERYRRYKGEVKDIELWMASHRFLEQRAVERIIRQELAELTQTLEDVRVELDAKDAKVISERAELALEERRLSELQEKLFEVENRVRLSESKIEFQTREAGQLDVRCQTAGEEIERLREQGESEKTDLEALQVEFEAIELDVASEGSGAAEREASLQEARDALSQAQRQLENARDELSRARADVVRSESSQTSIDGRTSDARTRLARLLEETRGMDERVKERETTSKSLSEKLANLVQTRLDLGNKTEEFTARKAELDENVSLCEAEVETLRTEVHRRKSRLQSLREIHDKYEGFARGTRAVMQHAGDLAGKDEYEIRGLVADVVNAPEKLEVAVEAALGDRLGGILVNKAEVGVRAIEYLKETSAGRSAFVPFMVPVAGTGGGIQYEDRSGMQATPTGEGVLGAMVDLVSFEDDYREVATNLLGQVTVVETLARALELRSLGVTQTMVTLDGDIVDSRGVVAGGSRDSQGASVLAQKREIRELEEIVDSLERDLTQATANFVSTKSELTKVSKAIEGLRNDRHDGELAITAHERDLQSAQSELEGLRERQARLNAEQLELEDRVGALEHEAKIMLELHETATAAMGRLESEQLGLIETVHKAQELVDERAMIATEAKVRVAQIGEKRASLEASILRLQKSQEVLAARVRDLTTMIETDSTRSEELRAECAQIKEELVELYEIRTTEGTNLDEGRREYGRRNADIQSDEVLVRELRSRAEKLAKKCSENEVKLEKIASDRRHLEESIEDRYHVELSRIVHEFHLRPRVSHEDEERLNQRRRVIERMGTDINLTAIEEFQTLSERHDFLATQQVDLESAVNQLEDAILKINKTSRRLFKETYHLINNKFQEMFPQLFRGGRARLSLTGGEDIDILEAGVEIHAQPPGKKNTTVDQLSGGEKALTAVALLFSIFLIKPSPFCLLDEVDAPLDEANVDRYNEILRAMTDHSQFIVITHNKRTMAVADRLYGVTMQEPGVSKLVTVNLQKVGEKIKAA